VGGADPLDAIVEGVKIQELDPSDTSVGYGGLPNADGVVQLDASCMYGPMKRAGAVGALEGIKTASEVVKLVLKYTPHILLVGAGAKRFALSYGFKEEDLLTDASRQAWLEWRANLSPNDNYLDVPAHTPMVVHPPTGTINCDAVTPGGDIASITTTAGLAFKIPGRVGDRAVLRHRRRRRRLHGARRGQYHDRRRIPDRRSDAPRHEAGRRLPRDVEACRAPDAAAAVVPGGAPPLPARFLRRLEARRVRRRGAVSQSLRRPRRHDGPLRRHRRALRHGAARLSV